MEGIKQVSLLRLYSRQVCFINLFLQCIEGINPSRDNTSPSAYPLCMAINVSYIRDKPKAMYYPLKGLSLQCIARDNWYHLQRLKKGCSPLWKGRDNNCGF